MDATTTDTGSAAAPPEVEGGAGDGMADAARGVWDEFRAVLHERGRLLTLEARLAGLTFVQLVLYSVLVAVLVVTAWLGLVACLVIGLISVGLHWAAGIVVGVAANLAVAAWLVRAMIAMLDRLDLQATLRRLKGDPAP